MATRPRTVTRQELSRLTVTDVDAFTALRYLRHRENVPAIPDLEERGRQGLPGVEGALLDLYHSLWSPEPQVHEEVKPDRRYWRTLLEQTLQSSAYQEIHASTQFRELLSILGTVSVGESLVAMVSEKDKQRLQELAQAQAKADDLQQQAQDAQAQAQTLQQLADAASEQAQNGQGGKPGQGGDQGQSQQGQQGQSKGQASGQTQPSSSGQPSGGAGQMTLEQATDLANQLAEQARTAQNQADSLQKQAEDIQAEAEQLANNLLGQPDSEQAQAKERELARMGMAALKKAQTKVEEASETLESWGLEAGELSRDSYEEAMAIFNAIKHNPLLKNLSAWVGRFRMIAARKARTKDAGEGIRVVRYETGRDIKRAVPPELVALTQRATRVKALTRWARGELRLRGEEVKKTLGKGQIIVCEDLSGSVSGDKLLWTVATVLALAYYAKLQKRSFGWILFDHAVQIAKVFLHGLLKVRDMITIAESRAGGGTDFEAPLRKAIEMMKKEGLKKADIVFITDGECAVSEEFLREFRAAKAELEFNVVAILCDVGSSAIATVRQFADKIERISSFSAKSVENQVFAHL